MENNNEDFRSIILKAYANIKNGGLTMYHPSSTINQQDPIAKSRVNEY